MAERAGALTGTAAFLAEVAPESERSLEVEAIYAWGTGDTVQQRRVKERLRSKPWYYRWYAAHGVARFARDPHGAADLLQEGSDDAALLQALVPNLLVVRGKHREFRTFMSGVEDRGSPSWDLFEAFVLTSGAYPASDRELDDVLARLTRPHLAQSSTLRGSPPTRT